MYTIGDLFDTTFKDYQHDEFFGKSGKEHYRLLSYFSSLHSNVHIIDIGTHMGNSALALSFNKTNTVHTFDIIKKDLNPYITSQTNITFHNDNIFEEKEKYKALILNSPFIFLDVDPHNGQMEYDFFNYLLSIEYNGFMICDDIWYFKDMRDNFWNKIDSSLKCDMTNFGHWSGTGIIQFGQKNELFKPLQYDNSKWTLVTAYFNLTKFQDASKEILERDFNYYLQHANFTLTLQYNLVIYCDQESYERISAIRPPDHKTKYIIKEFDKIMIDSDDQKRTFADYREQIKLNRQKNPYHFDNRNTPSYYLFCLSRYYMMKEVIKDNTFNSSHFAWINFCIERMGYTNLIHLDEALSVYRNKFSTCYIDYIPHDLVSNTHEYFKYGRCSMCSGFFTGNNEYMYKVCDLIEKKFLFYLDQGYGHADEQLYSPVYFENSELFDHYYGDYRQMITNYVYIYESPEAPIHNFIKNSFNHKEYKKCYEACKFVWISCCIGKCNMDQNYYQYLISTYTECKKQLNIFD
jgi:hypothetical protein